jgi:Protein of unknown function (DUF4065)
MADLQDIMAYIIQAYPSVMEHELSNARLTKMVYLSDWHMALNHGRQISDIKWYFDNFGPFVRDVEITAVSSNDIFSVDLGTNAYGQPKKTFSLKNSSFKPRLTTAEKKSIDHIVDVTRKLYWDDFIKLVYSTHPIASSERYSYLNLVNKAAEYKKRKAS